jgi:hypothetical protein
MKQSSKISYWSRAGKFYSDEARLLLQGIKLMGISFCFVEIRMGKASNWGRRLAAGRGLVNDDDLEYLRKLYKALKQLPERRAPTRKHAGQFFDIYTNPLKPKRKLTKPAPSSRGRSGSHP